MGFLRQMPCVLTIITPTYNRADMLRETIDSVQSQAFRGLQYIIMDDGSSDDTRSVVRAHGKRVEYYHHQNIGEQKTVNRALQLVRGEFFMIVNSDDPLLPGCLNRMVRTLTKNPNVLAAYPDWQVIDAQSKPLATIRVGSFDTSSLLNSTSVPIGPGACFRRSVLEMVGFRNPLLRYSADLDYWYRITLVGKIVHVPETLATHRVHAGSASIAERGDLLAREARYLFEAYGRHPLAPGRLRRSADAYGHFVAAFVCTDLRSMVRELVRSFLAHPVAFLDCLQAYGAEETAESLRRLGAVAGGEPGPATRAITTARCRAADYRKAVRAALHDPLEALRAIQEYGLSRLAADIRRLPIYRPAA